MFRSELRRSGVVVAALLLPLPPQSRPTGPEDPIAEQRESGRDEGQSDEQSHRYAEHDGYTDRSEQTKARKGQRAEGDDDRRSASSNTLTSPRNSSLDRIILPSTHLPLLRIPADEEDAIVGAGAQH